MLFVVLRANYFEESQLVGNFSSVGPNGTRGLVGATAPMESEAPMICASDH